MQPSLIDRKARLSPAKRLIFEKRLLGKAISIAGQWQIALSRCAERGEGIPLSYAQQRLWFLSQMKGVSEAYHISFGVRLKGGLNVGALRQALDRILVRHEALRTVFRVEQGESVQKVAAAGEQGFVLVEHDLRGYVEMQAKVERLIAEECGNSFDLKAGPLIRGRLIQLAEDEHVLLVTMHHIVSDGWSMGVMFNELSVLYGVFLRGEADPLPELEVQYADYAVWQREWMEGEILREQGEYWRKTLAGAPAVLEVAGDHVRPAEQDFAGAFARLELDAKLTEGLKELSRKHGATLYMTLLAGWAAMLGRLSGQQDVVIGTPVANRGRSEIEGLIGFFVNTLALRLDLTGSPTVGEFLERVKEQALAAQEHQDIPFEQVVELVRPVRSLSHSPVFQVMFAWGNAPGGKLELSGLELRPLPLPHIMSRFDLTLTLEEAGEGIVGGVEYATALFERSTIERYLEYFRRLLEGMVADEMEVMDRLALLDVAERQQIVQGWNETGVEYAQKCVHELFEEQVERSPEAVAVVFEGEQLTYGELNRRANRLGHYLRRLGIRPDERVAICVERGLEMVVGLMGILKAGGAYVPLDPAYPEERLRFMMEDSAPAVLLTQGHLKELFRGMREIPVLDIGEGSPAWRSEAETNPAGADVGLTRKHLAYIIYTSGSTGTAKGVMVEHRHITRLFEATGAWFQFDENDIWTLFHSYAFDFSVWEIWGALLYGGRLIVISKDIARSPEDFYRLMCQSKVTILSQTPSAFRHLIAAQAKSKEWHQLRQVVFGGEALEISMLRPWYEQSENRRTQLVNMYGITETTVHVTYRPLEQGDTERAGRSKIGCRIPDLKIYILDSYGEPVPVGVGGELYIGGVGVARGYWKRPELTAEKFIADPFSGEAGTRMYKTGDVGRWLADGSIEFLGRNDEQVKIRGYRIELGEIEAALVSHRGVREAVVVAREDEPGEKRLVAYYTAEGEGAGAEELRGHLSAKLPEYMVPAAYVKLERLPLTVNGKLDRKGLPAPGGDAYGVQEYEEPRGETEKKLAEIWAEVLKVERVGRQDNFFELGGHSLLAVTLIERMRRSGLQVDVRALFAKPTLAELAATVDGAVKVEVPANKIPEGCEAIRPEMLPLVSLTQEEIDCIVGSVPGGVRNIQDIYPLAPLQEGILFHHLMGGEGDPYLLANLTSFDSRARLEAYVNALQGVIDRHDILRTGVAWEGLREPVQVVWRKAVLQVEEVKLGLGDSGEQLYGRFNPRHYRIDVRHAPLLRVYIAHDEEKERWLMMELLHHLAGDHTTLEVMQEEVQAYLLGQSERLPKLQPFRNLVAQARLGVSREEHEEFFRELLGDVEEPTAPFGLIDVQGDGTGIEEARILLDSELARRIRERARKLGVSAASVCHLAWAQVLARVSGRKDVVFGTVLFGRMQGGAGADRVMGLFINTLPVRIRVGEEGVEASVRGTHRQLAELLRHEHASLALAQRCSGVVAPRPLFSAMLNYRHSARQVISAEARRAWEGMEWLRGEERTNYPLTLSVDDLGEGFGLTAQVEASIDPKRVCEFMRRALESLVEALERAPAKAVSTIDVLPEEERQQVLYEWNETGAEYAQKCVHELFEEQVERSPEAVAVVFEGEQLTYGELNRRANRLGHYLRRLGIRPDERVAICVERGLEMVVGLMGILKAGGAYVPLDPAYPEERLRFMMEDSAPAVLLTQGHLKELFRGMREIPVLDIGEGSPAWRSEAETNPAGADVGLTRKHLAYIIYTSGSTGRPKGVAVEHGELQNALVCGWKSFGVCQQDVMAAVASSAFDISLLELITPWLAGACNVVLSRMEILDVELLVDRLRGVTILHAVPSLMRQVIGVLKSRGKERDAVRLRSLWTGGDKVAAELLGEMREVFPDSEIWVLYGPTETTIICADELAIGRRSVSPIGRPIANTRIYILDSYGEPVPVGVGGELYIGGVGVARGYWKRPELTAEKFIADPFSGEAGTRMYKTGDVGRWLADGSIEFLGRNDEQVKIRGYRIELGEIEAALVSHRGVREAVVVAREDEPGEKRLVAYYTAEGEGAGAEELRGHLSAKLPEYMVPAAYVKLERLPLTVNGKLDRKGLPAPGGDAYGVQEYEEPRGETEKKLAEIWAEVLKVERVGRQDNFFELGGHSLLAVTLIERMRRSGLQVDVRALFAKPTLAELAATVDGAVKVEVPANKIPEGCEAIRPEMLPLVSLTQEEIDCIVGSVPGGVRNIQDIYPLAPLQEGILFHHLMGGEGDPYLLANLTSFDSRARLEAYVNALQGVIDRHDILRTGVAWEGLREPVQVVWRKAVLQVEEVKLGLGDSGEQLYGRFNPRHYRIDVRHAPLLRVYIAHDEEKERWLMMELLHHLAGDHTTLEVMQEEVQAYLLGQSERLPKLQPFRNLVAQARLGVSREEHEEFFRELLGDVEEPTAPFGLIDVQGDGTGIEEARILLDSELARRIRERARKLGVSAASVCHLAWAQVLARVSGRKDVVFGTVLFGRMQGGAGADRVMGLFINTLPVRIRVGEEGVEASVRGTHRQLAELLRHEHASLALAQRCSGVVAPRPLFSAMLNYRHSARQVISAEARRAWEGMEWLRGEERTNYPLTLSVDDLGEGFGLTAQVEASIDPKRVCEFMRRALESLVEALERAPAKAVSTIDVLPEEERQQVLYEWNETGAEYAQKCVHELFEEQVERSPEAVAVVFEGEQLTYGELNRRANRLGHYLRRLGIRPDERVAICVERGLEMVVGLMGILKAGGAYVPLDPAYPEERLRFMMEDSAPAVLLTQGHLKELFRGMREIPVLDIGEGSPAWRSEAETNPAGADVGLTRKHLAYIIYTSGSTGRPKGVMGTHLGMVNRLFWMWREFPFQTNEKGCLKTSLNFLDSFWETFGYTLRGVPVVVIRDAVVRDNLRLVENLEAAEITRIVLVPSLLRVILESNIDLDKRLMNLTFWVSSGEELPPELVLSFQQVFPRARLLNLYGSSEVAADCTWHEVTRALDVRVVVGRPISNMRIYILDSYGEPVPVGVGGELYIGGVGVARGYWKRPELTAEKFIADPFSGEAGTRMYKTGDVGRWLADGSIEFLGRNDEQVKIRGYRIELGEIEAALVSHRGVREAVVVAREDEPGEKRLVAYYTAEGEGAGAEELRGHLSAKLPEYMVPAAYVKLERLPLTPSGKLDRTSLPTPEGDAYVVAVYEEPRGESENTLAAIWSELLNVKRVGRQDNFFELGGHSLLAMRLIVRIRQVMGVEVMIRGLFAHSRLRDLAHDIESATPTTVPLIARAKRSGRLPLSYAQQRLWFLDRLEGTSAEYNVSQAMRLRGVLHMEALQMAVNAIVERHETLRTQFAEIDGEPVQIIAPNLHMDVPLIDLSELEEGERRARTSQEVREEAARPFDLSGGAVLRLKMLKLGEKEHILLRTMHHIATDGWSEGVFNRELKILYEAYRETRENPLKPLKVQYADFAIWQRSWLNTGALDEGLKYWKKQLEGIPEELRLPRDHPRATAQTFGAGVCEVMLSSEQTAGLKSVSQEYKGTLFMTLLAAFGVLLSRYTGQNDIVIGSPIANRQQVELEDLIGFFVNKLVIRMRVRDGEKFRELLREVRETVLEAYRYQDVPFERLVEELAPKRNLNLTPVYQVSFAFQNAPQESLELKGLKVDPVGGADLRVRFDFEVHAWEREGKIGITWLYNRDLFDRWRIEQMVRHYVCVLDAAIDYAN